MTKQNLSSTLGDNSEKDSVKMYYANNFGTEPIVCNGSKFEATYIKQSAK